MKIKESQFYLIERTLQVGRENVLKFKKVADVRNALLERCKDTLFEICQYAVKSDRATYKNLFDASTSLGDLRYAIQSQPDLIRSAVRFYRECEELDEELYTELLDKKVSEMSGYEFMLLYTKAADKAYYDKWIDTANR